MEHWLITGIHAFLAIFALPQVGLPAIFIVSLVSATLLPMGSEPAVFAYVQLNQHMFWPAVLVATVGNTLGGVISYYMGYGAAAVWHKMQLESEIKNNNATATADMVQDQLNNNVSNTIKQADKAGGRWHKLASSWFKRVGPPALLLSWLPGIGDPLCAVAGWLHLPFWPSVAYMAIGKLLRYIVFTYALLQAWPWFI